MKINDIGPLDEDCIELLNKDLAKDIVGANGIIHMIGFGTLFGLICFAADAQITDNIPLGWQVVIAVAAGFISMILFGNIQATRLANKAPGGAELVNKRLTLLNESYDFNEHLSQMKIDADNSEEQYDPSIIQELMTTRKRLAASLVEEMVRIAASATKGESITQPK